MRMWVCLAVAALPVGLLGPYAVESSERAADRQAAAKHIVGLLAARDFETAVKSFDAAMSEALPAANLGEVWQTLEAQAGPFKEQTGARQETEAGLAIVFVTCRFQHAVLEAKIAFDASGKIAGLYFVPPRATAEHTMPEHSMPAYARPEAFSARQVTVGSGVWVLPGTLLIPSGEGRWPGLVLVHGSGPLDRDESIGPNRPFYDLALGLASRGIAVLRYDKRTLAHKAEMASENDRVTLKEETVDDAVAAAALLRRTPEIDGQRVFVLGHSLGGIAVPRIAEGDPQIAGFIMMATPCRPLEDVVLDQAAYLTTLDGPRSDKETADLEELGRQVARVKSPELATAADPGELPLGGSRAYWLDLSRHPAPPAAAKLRRPLLIVQGGRDYQSTTRDFDLWRETLAGRSSVQMKLYPGLNHLFMEGSGKEGSGKSTPSEYDAPGHVAPVVIEDLAAWIKGQTARPGPTPGRAGAPSGGGSRTGCAVLTEGAR